MARKGSGIVDVTQLQNGIDFMDDRIGARLGAIVRFNAERMQNEAKMNAPWTDRTSNARNGLTATAVVQARVRYAIVLHHMVSYGMWLELSNNMRYAIIMPTIENSLPGIRSQIRGMMGGL